MTCFRFPLVVVLLLAVACATGGQETEAPLAPASPARDELRARADRQFDLLREEGRAASKPLLLYPEDVLRAMLEISRDPALIVRTLDASGDPGKLAEVSDDYPPEMQAAARTLAKNPEVLRILEEHLIVAAVLGAMYDDDPQEVRRLLDARVKEVNAREAEALDDWKGRLENDPEAMRQMQEATRAYEEQGGSAAASGATTSGSSTSIYAAPSYSYTVYVMNHCDSYYSMCGHMHYHSYNYGAYYADYWDDQWDDYWAYRNQAREDWQEHLNEGREDRQENRDERREERRGEDPEARREQARQTMDQAGNGGMSQAAADWKERNADVLPDGFFADDGKLGERMRSFGKSEGAFREGLGSGKYSKGDRQRVMDQRSTRRGAQPAGTRASARSREAPISRPQRVERGEMSRSQRIERAQGAHRSAWGSRSSGGYAQRRGGMGGGGRRGGGMRGGGGRRGGRR
jgi:uncharacterized membrane protein YgcG